MCTHKATPNTYTSSPALKGRFQVLRQVFFPRTTCYPPIPAIIANLKVRFIRPAYQPPIPAFIILPKSHTASLMLDRQIGLLAGTTSCLPVLLKRLPDGSTRQLLSRFRRCSKTD